MPIDDFPGRISIGVDGNDDVWLGVQIAYFPGALGRFDGQSWHMYDQLGGSPVEGARVLDSVIGALWIAIQPNEAEVSTYLVNRVDSADSTQILTVPGALTATEPFVGGDGQVWIQTEQGPARYDYGWTDGWSHPYADFPLATSYWSFAVAADGTFFGESATGIVRFPPVN
jgi:hypothetical protein